MKRSSKIVIVAAIALLGGSGILLARAQDSIDAPMSQAVAADIIARGAHALERGDVNGVMDLMVPGAHMLGRSEDQIRPLIQEALQQMGRSRFIVTTHNLEVHPEDRSARAAFDLDIDEHSGADRIHYFTMHLSLTLTRVRRGHWLGLYHTDQWKISDIQPDGTLEIPTP